MIAARALADHFGGGGSILSARAPGRVNLLGEHTDYNDGFVLPTILGCHVEVAVRRQAGSTVRMLAADLDESIEFTLGADLDQQWPGWAPYLAGLTEEMRARDLIDGGFDLAVCGTVPRGSGLSSSAALEIAAALALENAFGFRLDPLSMVHLCRDVEHHWAGVRCGIMDQMACRLGLPAHALLIDCRDGSHRHLPLKLEGHALVVTDSGVRRELGDSAYNERRLECEEGVAALQQHTEAIHALRDLELESLATLEEHLAPHLADRCRHVVNENARVLAGEVALAVGNLPVFGNLMVASHESLRDLFAASHPVVDRLVDTALCVPGVLGSRLTGAGFGGCTVTLCKIEAVEQLQERLEAVFAELDVPGEVMASTPATAAGIISEEE